MPHPFPPRDSVAARTASPVCGAPTSPLPAVDHVPPQQNRFFATPVAAIAAIATDVKFLWCGACLHIGVKKDRAVGFDCEYDNRQSHSSVARAHLASVAQKVAIRARLYALW